MAHPPPLVRSAATPSIPSRSPDILSARSWCGNAGGLLSGRIVETEAYLARRRRRSRLSRRDAPQSRALPQPGHAYVYLAYGVSYMLNVSSESRRRRRRRFDPGAEPLEGIATMQRNRGVQHLRDLARGPDRLAAAFPSIGGSTASTSARMVPSGSRPVTRKPGDIGQGVRIGASPATPTAPCDFYVRGSPFVSGPRSLNA